MMLNKDYKKVERLSKFIKGKPTSLPKLRVFLKSEQSVQKCVVFELKNERGTQTEHNGRSVQN